MDSSREKRLRHKLRVHQIQVREKNKAERRLLASRLSQINLSSRKSTETLEHQMKLVEREVRQQHVINEDNAEFESRLQARMALGDGSCTGHNMLALSRDNLRSKSAPLANVTRSVSSLPNINASKQFQVSWKPPLDKPKPKCRYGAWGNRCANFPCDPFDDYNHIGFDIQSSGEKFSSFKTGTQLYARARESLIIDLESASVRRPLRTANDQTSRKIISLKKIIEQMKVKSEQNRPKDWCTNYGKPISMRKLLKVARPESRDISSSL